MKLLAIFLLIGASAALPSGVTETQSENELLKLELDLGLRSEGEVDEMYKEDGFGGLKGNDLGLAVLEQQRKELEAYRATHPEPEPEKENAIKKYFSDLLDKSKTYIKDKLKEKLNLGR